MNDIHVIIKTELKPWLACQTNKWCNRISTYMKGITRVYYIKNMSDDVFNITTIHYNEKIQSSGNTEHVSFVYKQGR